VCFSRPIGIASSATGNKLSADEQLRADRFRFEQHRQHFIIGRGVLRAILGRYMNIEPSHSGGDNPLKRLAALAIHPLEFSKNRCLLTGY
jgi:4'-phosphopantetheinyl transferase